MERHFPRVLNLAELLRRKSFFLFGPRSTGKSTLVREQLGERALVVDLLRTDNLLRLSARPGDLEGMIRASGKQLVVIDEVQKLPIILDEVQRAIEEMDARFLLTGSSARKLRHGNANLLAGRAWTAELFPLVSHEIGAFDLDRFLMYGGLPQVYPSEDPAEELDAYVGTYLREEIQAEGAVRDLPRFGRLLTLAALGTGQVLNFSNIARDIGISPSTVIEHFRILEDTLIGFFVQPWGQSTRRKEVASAKFYLFDTGVMNTLARVRALEPASDLYGRAFEQFLAMELRAALSYQRSRRELSYWRTYDKNEVDFVIDGVCAIEVKATERTSDRDARSLKRLRDEGRLADFFLVSRDPIDRTSDGIQFLHYRRFLERLWSGQILRAG